jgi:hypothetical protein
MPGPEPDGAGGRWEEEFRGALASVPLSRLRAAGILDALVALAKDQGGAPGPSGGARPAAGEVTAGEVTDVDGLVHSATPDELFDFIDAELGLPGAQR